MSKLSKSVESVNVSTGLDWAVFNVSANTV